MLMFGMDKKCGNHSSIASGYHWNIGYDVTDRDILRVPTYIESGMHCPQCRQEEMGATSQLPHLPSTRGNTFFANRDSAINVSASS